MKKKYWKTVILLTLVATLLTGILLGCNDGTDLGNFNDDIIGGGTCHPEWDAAPDDAYYAVDLQWAAEIMELEKARDISTGSATVRVGIINGIQLIPFP